MKEKEAEEINKFRLKNERHRDGKSHDPFIKRIYCPLCEKLTKEAGNLEAKYKDSWHSLAPKAEGYLEAIEKTKILSGYVLWRQDNGDTHAREVYGKWETEK